MFVVESQLVPWPAPPGPSGLLSGKLAPLENMSVHIEMGEENL